MKYILSAILALSVMSCVKQEPKPQLPLPAQPIITDSTIVNNGVSLVGQTWKVSRVLVTGFASEDRQDTIVFLQKPNYTFNGDTNTYSLYSTPTGYKLNLNNTPWGHIGGTLVDYNISAGSIDGLDFVDIFNTSRKVKLWMTRL
jgi:hypothetical protein